MPGPPPLDPYVLDTLMPDLVGHDRKPAAFVVYLCLWRRSRAGFSEPVRLSHQQLADATGLSRSAVQEALRWLQRRQLVESRRASPTAIPAHFVRRPWRRG